MKVAIMGAGLSGLACAKHLEDHGITPIIFERRHRVGERFPNTEVVIQVMHRPLKDPLIFLNKKFNISLLPTAIIHTIEIYSPNKKLTLSGYNLGYTSIRGNDERSWERQLAKQIKSDIVFNSTATWQELEKEFDKIVIATGDPTISRELGVWKTDAEAFLMGSNVKGNFNTGIAKLYLDQKLSKQGYVFFAPFDTNEATFTVAAHPSSPDEVEVLWSNTVSALNLNPIAETEFKFEEYKLGRASTKQIGKILLTGAAAGCVDPFLGFGQIPSILAGVYAAKSIITGKDYNKLTHWLDKQYKDCYEIRKFINELNNDGFDKLVHFFNIPLMNKMLGNTNTPILNIVANILRGRNIVKKLTAWE